MSDQVFKELAKPFPFHSHKWRVMNVSKKDPKAHKGTVAYYIDARDVMDRLDQSGAFWSDNYQVLENGPKVWHVECTLIVNGVVRTDVGEGDDPKSAYSDALKRAAVKFGVYRYGYSLKADKFSYGWLPMVNTYGDNWEFSEDSNRKIAQMLKEQLEGLGAPVEESAELSPEVEQEIAESFDDIPGARDKDIITAVQLKALNKLGKECYGIENWAAKSKELAETASAGNVKDIGELMGAEADILISGIRKKLNTVELVPAGPDVGDGENMPVAA